MHDLVIRDALVVDGTGSAARHADVAVDGATIAAVGEVGRGRREIDAGGRLLTPGFVDIHTHYDAQVTWDPQLTPSSWHGCTSVVMGSCGVGFAPVRPGAQDWLIGLMEGVEDIPGAAMHEGITWGWESFPEYLDAIDQPHAIDFGTQVPHGALRAYVMGERANDEATEADIVAMRSLVREAIEAGALGFSTSRTSLHKSIDGEPVPGTFATREELFGIGRALGDAGRGVFQLAAEHSEVPGELEWMTELALETGRPVMLNLSQIDQSPTLWREGLAAIERANERGAHIRAQVAGRAIGIVMGWDLTAHPFATYVTWGEVMNLTPEERRVRLADPDFRRRMLADEPLDLDPFSNFVTRSFDKMFLTEGGVDYEPDPQQSIAAIALRTQLSPQQVAYDALASDGMLYFPLFNYADGNLDLLHELHSHPLTLMGLSDAGAHCGAICDGGMPTFMLSFWARDRKRGPTLPLEHVIRRQTRDTARAFGMPDRGVVAPGMKADLNVIDLDALELGRPEIAYDLPAGGRRLLQRAKGYVATICSGEVILENDVSTGTLPGRLLRGPQRLRASCAA